MQHSVDTVDPNLLDLRQFPHPSTSDSATIRDEPVEHQWSGKHINEDINHTIHGTSVQDHQSFNYHFDSQLEILGQFEFTEAYESDGQSQSWGDQNLESNPVVQEETFDNFQGLGHAGPWNHLQSFSSQTIYHNQRYGLSNDLSYGVPSSSETVGSLGGPSTSPPDSSSAFVPYDSIIDARRAQYAEPFILTQHGDVNCLNCNEEQKNPDAASNSSTAQVLPGQEKPELYSLGGGRRISNDICCETFDPHIETPSLYQHCEAVSQQSDGNSSKFPIETLLRYHNLASPNNYSEPISYYNDEPDFCYYEDPLSEYAGVTHPQLATICIEGTSERFQLDAASSFPPMAGCFPKYWPGGPKEEPRPKSRPASRSLPLHPASRNSRGNREPSIVTSEPPLSVIHEDGKGGLASSSPTTKKGRRAGPLSKSKAAQAAKMRKEKSVCIRCKMMKQSCSGEVPCTGCRENVGAKIWKSPCVKADFLDLIEAGTCNYICRHSNSKLLYPTGNTDQSQRSINHLTLNQSRRVTILLPTTFDLAKLLDLLKPRLSRFNIHARQLSGSLYTLDLAKCYDFLVEIRNLQESRKFELQDFIDNKLLKAPDWLKCVTEPCSMTESLALLAKWNNMPSRASYDIVSLSEGVASRPMDIESPDDKEEIVIAAQLSRIICRALEVAAFKYLQKELNALTKGSKSNEGAEKFVRELGQLLVTLRWRICWWELLGDGSAIRDDSRDRYVERVKNITRVLYFYYCSAKKKLPSWTEPQSLKGVQSYYADAEPIFDNFPHADSIDGFHEWMMHGQDLIRDAGVQRRLSRY